MEPGSLDARVSALEHRVGMLTTETAAAREDAAAARHLAAAHDRDLVAVRAEIRDFRQATAASFTALRADVSDLRTEVGSLRTDQADLRTEVGSLRTDQADLRAEVGSLRTDMDRGFLDIRGRLDGTAAGLTRITSMLTTLIDRDDGPPEGTPGAG